MGLRKELSNCKVNMKVVLALILAFVVCDNINAAAIAKVPPPGWGGTLGSERPLGSERTYSIEDYLYALDKCNDPLAKDWRKKFACPKLLKAMMTDESTSVEDTETQSNGGSSGGKNVLTDCTDPLQMGNCTHGGIPEEGSERSLGSERNILTDCSNPLAMDGCTHGGIPEIDESEDDES